MRIAFATCRAMPDGSPDDHLAASLLGGEFVVKPNVSAGARNTGRFGAEGREQARALVERIHASGRVALVQPSLADVDERGETALVFLGGELSHALSKRPVLREQGVAPVALAREVVDEISGRFGS